MPIRGSPNGARHPHPQVVAIARNGWSRSVGTGGRDQSKSLVAFSRCAQSPLITVERWVELGLSTAVKYQASGAAGF